MNLQLRTEKNLLEILNNLTAVLNAKYTYCDLRLLHGSPSQFLIRVQNGCVVLLLPFHFVFLILYRIFSLFLSNSRAGGRVRVAELVYFV